MYNEKTALFLCSLSNFSFAKIILEQCFEATLITNCFKIKSEKKHNTHFDMILTDNKPPVLLIICNINSSSKSSARAINHK